ncbi:AraC family transcriptional regulator [Lactobacillus isalae]|uniref:AraC family transcriptional regulator n=1 Tax=Lactobacillus isalae TaxID=2993455 RepID=UPI0024A81977|nr:AraC family transcriptional regulator [Lactobacillus isalae]
MNTKLLDLLLEPSPIEIEQLRDHKFHSDIPKELQFSIQKQQKIPVLTSNLFKNQSIYVKKHNRFAPYPTHMHTFLELNYVLQGTVKEKVNNEFIVLKKGDLLLLNKGAIHSIAPLDKNDLMVNIIFNSQKSDFQNLIQQDHDYLKQVFLTTILKSNFLVFRHKNIDDSLKKLTNIIIEEYYFPKEYSTEILANLTNTYFLLLYRNIQTTSKFSTQHTENDILLILLHEIMENYNYISLTQVAEKYNYNKNYLSNLFSERLGQTFSQVLIKKRLSIAYNQLLTTNKSISDILTNVGFTNKTFFYKKFEKQFQMKPSEVRKNN